MGIIRCANVIVICHSHLHFPFSDLTASKLRPAVVLAGAGRGDWILCQITSKSYGDEKANVESSALPFLVEDTSDAVLVRWNRPCGRPVFADGHRLSAAPREIVTVVF